MHDQTFTWFMSDSEKGLLQTKATAWINDQCPLPSTCCSCEQSFSHITMDKMCDLIKRTSCYHYCSALWGSSTAVYSGSKTDNKHKQQVVLAVQWIKYNEKSQRSKLWLSLHTVEYKPKKYICQQTEYEAGLELCWHSLIWTASKAVTSLPAVASTRQMIHHQFPIENGAGKKPS